MPVLDRSTEAASASSMPQLLRTQEKTYTQAERDALAKTGAALPDGSFPITDQASLDDAVQAIGRAAAGKRPAVKAHIISRAKALGLKLPDSYREAGEPGTSDDPTGAPDAPATCSTCNGAGTYTGTICPTCSGSGTMPAQDDDPLVPVEEAAKVGVVLRNTFVPLREATKTASGIYDVVLITEGPGNAGQRNWYTRESIQQLVASGLGEGLRAYADHPSKSEERDRPERSVRTLIGYYRKVRSQESAGRAQAAAELVVNAGPSFDWVRDMLDAAIAAREADGVPNLVGISIDGGGFGDEGIINGQSYTMVREFAVLASADVVTQPGAGGQIVRRIRESLTSLVASRPSIKENAMKVTDLQASVRDAVKKLREAAGQDTKDEAAKKAADTMVEAALTALDGCATAEVEPIVQFKESTAGSVPIERFREVETRATTAEAKADTLERTITASRLVRESKQPETLHATVIGTLVRECKTEDEMKALLAGKDAETEAIIKQVTESMRPIVEGVRTRQPAPVVGDDGGRANAQRAGLPLLPVPAAA